MGTTIGWTDDTWNPTTGCSHVSPGCDNCYAETLSLFRGWSEKSWTARNAADNVVLHPDRLDKPLRWRNPRMVFVDSMSDLFHEKIPDAFRSKVYATMAYCGALAKGHVFQILTKRHYEALAYLTAPAIVDWCEYLSYMAGEVYGDEADCHVGNSMRGLLADGHNVGWPLNNVWLVASVEDQRRAEERVPVLLGTPAAVRGLSVEPLLEHVDVSLWLGMGIDWVVIGGETGKKASRREMSLRALESLVDQCVANQTPVYVKQDSGPYPSRQGRIPDELWAYKQFPEL